MRLEQYLVLSRYLHRLFGAEDFDQLKTALYGIQEGPTAEGQSHFYGALAGREHLQAELREKLAEYDRRVMHYEARLSRARGEMRLKYFQYLALLYSEVYLDRLTADPLLLAAQLNASLGMLEHVDVDLADVPKFAPADLRRLAFFMATGSGKTLLMHVHLWQMEHYLRHGRQPDALVQRLDGRRLFRNILLITPSETLSAQHLDEFRLSGIEAQHLTQAQADGDLFGPLVKVVEIHKLAEEATGGGVSVSLESLGSANLVLVDEGHKGTGSEAQTWKNRQRALSQQGFLLEYSATFAQAIGAANSRSQSDLLAEYGKAILFDYSYRHFYADGYGKDFRVLNLERGTDADAHELLLGGLLTFYQQVYLHRQGAHELRDYNVEAPLWVFVGSSVNGMYTRNRQRQSDVATVVAFLRRFLTDVDWAIGTIGKLLAGHSGFVNPETQEDLFGPHLSFLAEQDPAQLYEAITEAVFHGRGALEVAEIKNADGELGLRVSAPTTSGTASHSYFGVINIGDVSAFKRHLKRQLGLEVGEDHFTASLFSDIDRQASPISVLVGAKKFIEGWSSWRVSAMGLLNVGKGQGSQIIQLFGRGVRLKGKHLSLKRSAFLAGDSHPAGIEELETLHIFGWNADYVQQFREVMEQEGLMAERRVGVRVVDPWPALPVPSVQPGYDVTQETWVLRAERPFPTMDLSPRVSVVAGQRAEGAVASTARRVEWCECMSLVDLPALYCGLLEYKQARGFGNLFMPRGVVPEILKGCELMLPEHQLSDASALQAAALSLLRKYVDRFYVRRERAAESRRLQPGLLPPDHQNIVRHYTLRIGDDDLLRRIEELLANSDRLFEDEDAPLPRLYLDSHLYNPILRDPAAFGLTSLSVSPPGLTDDEAAFVKDLRKFWAREHSRRAYGDKEVFVLRNLPRAGIGFYRKSGFYPDFILWLIDLGSGRTRVVFVEPHGMHHGGLPGNEDKLDAFRDLERLSSDPAFADQGISLDGYVLTKSRLDEIPGAEHIGWDVLERDYKVMRQDGDYIRKLLEGPAPTVQ